MVDDGPGTPAATPAASPLEGLRVQRVDAPAPGLLALTLTSRELKGVLLIGLDPPARGVGWVAERPRGEPASGFVQKLRRTLGGGRVTSLGGAPGGARLGIHARGVDYELRLGLAGKQGNAELCDEGGRSLARLRRPAPSGERSHPIAADLEGLERAGQALLSCHREGALTGARVSLARALSRADKRLDRRLAKIEADRARVDEVAELRHLGGLLLSSLHALPADATTAVLEDASREPPVRHEVRFEPGLGPAAQAERWFQRARKLERGAGIADSRAETTRRDLARIRELSAAVERTDSREELDALAARARELGVEPPSGRGRRDAHKERLPYRQFVGHGGHAILVGRGAADNDRLTLQHARPHDLWLHAREAGGAHVVVALERGQTCSPELLCDAATLAAHFSQQRAEPRVDVSYVERRHVRKPRKAPPGTVLLDREKVFRLEMEPERLSRLMATERRRS